MFLCLTPIALAEFGIHGSDQWQYASLIGVVLGLLITIWRGYVVRSRLPTFPKEMPVLVSFSVINFILMIGNTIMWRTSGPYVLAVISSLAAASSIFLAMIFRMFPISSSKSGENDT